MVEEPEVTADESGKADEVLIYCVSRRGGRGKLRKRKGEGEMAYGNRLHGVPAKIRLERQSIHDIPIPYQQPGATHRNPLRALVGSHVALLLDFGQLHDLGGRLAQTVSQVVGAIVERRDTDSYLLRGAFNLNGEFLATSGITDEVPDLGGRGPAHEILVSIIGFGTFAPEAGIFLHGAFA